MASTSGAVWAIEIGNDTLKALHLRLAAADTVEVIGFDSISYGKVLNAEGLRESERDELIALALRNFLRQNIIAKDDVIIPVPSQNSFARFVNLPPVEEKKIPQVVKLEAGMQIPFDINEVQWDWQLLSEKGASEAKVGIFAVKNDVINKELDYFSNEDIPVNFVQMTPMALYNFIMYDRPEIFKSEKQAVMVLNIGSENTDLVICTKSTVWQRCMPIGGNAFTRAIADTFKLSFSKAEKLKRTAAMSKYARQVFQAMRPVFSDFVSELQRSIGFYNNSNPNTKLSYVIAMGGGTKLRGLLKYIQQSLQVSVEKPDSFKNIVLNPQVSAAKFHENVGDFGVVYGLAVQALGLGTISVNLLPRTIAKSMMWAAKAKYFTYAAIALLVVSAMAIGRTVLDTITYNTKKNVRSEVASVIGTAEEAQQNLRTQQARGEQSRAVIEEAKKLFENRDMVARVYGTILSVLPDAKNNPEQSQLYEAFESGDVKALTQIPRKLRKQVFLTSISVVYSGDLEAAEFGKVDTRVTTRQQDASAALKMGFIIETQQDGIFDDLAGQGTEDTGRAGFVVILTGYTPYENFTEVLDPAGVGEDKSKWGVVTRLENLSEMSNGENIFELYMKTDRKHFELDWQEVSHDSLIPQALAIKEKVDIKPGKSIFVLKDALTGEIISRVPELDESGREQRDRRTGRTLYQINDHSFVLKFKILLKSGQQAPSDEGFRQPAGFM